MSEEGTLLAMGNQHEHHFLKKYPFYEESFHPIANNKIK